MSNILLVDDDEDLSEMLFDLLSFQKHSVVSVATGADALRQMKIGRFDLILLDWQLPDMTGIDVCRRYREEGGRSAILMLTGMRDSQFREAARQSGVDNFLAKPFTLEQILPALAATLPVAIE